MMKTGILYIVATPIGHLDDITLRAVAVLKSVDLVAAEDTRHSSKLFHHHDIRTKLLSLHEHNEAARAARLCEKLKSGISIALISDAGTPLISDPGYRLVQQVREAGIKIIPIPGPCAAISALVASGLPTDRFVFEGFLPPKGEVRHKRLIALKQERRTLIFYESVHRIRNLLDLLHDTFGSNRQACVARELTKTFETIHAATLAELKAWINADANQCKGEFVVVVEGAEVQDDVLTATQRKTLTVLLSELPLKQAVLLTVEITGAKRKIVYDEALKQKQQ